MVASAIACFTTPAKVTRFGDVPDDVNGVPQVNTDFNTFSVDISIQPLTGRERMVLPANIQDREVVKLYAPCEIRGVDTVSKREADRIQYNGREYIAHVVEDWFCLGGYYKVLAVKVDT